MSEIHDCGDSSWLRGKLPNAGPVDGNDLRILKNLCLQVDLDCDLMRFCKLFVDLARLVPWISEFAPALRCGPELVGLNDWKLLDHGLVSFCVTAAKLCHQGVGKLRCDFARIDSLFPERFLVLYV